MFVFAEINTKTGAVNYIGEAPFVPEFAPGSLVAVDITNITPRPEQGWTWDGETFSPPPEASGEPDPSSDGYLGDLILETATGGLFAAENTELNVTAGQPVVVTGKIKRDGQVLAYIPTGNPETPLAPFTVPTLRLPLLPTDLQGRPLIDTQPSMAVASINKGVVTASWTPEFTGTYAITEDGVNVRLPEGHKLRVAGLQIFVLPEATQ